MNIKQIRFQTGLSQSKFATMFGIPVSTLKDWEQGRRTPPAYVVNMIKTILELRGTIIVDDDYIAICESRRKSVERVMAVLLTATNGPDEVFMDVLDSYISGRITLEEMEIIADTFTDSLERAEYGKYQGDAKEQYRIAKSDYEVFREKYAVKNNTKGKKGEKHDK